jgi:hypothetical protein
LPQAVVGEFAGVFFQGGEVEIGNPGFAYEADQQVPHHFGMGKQALVAGIVVSHLAPLTKPPHPHQAAR